MPPSRTIADKLAQTHARIERAAARAGRDPASVTLLAVSKGHGPEAIVAAYEAGQRDFGENYAQELVRKAQELGPLPDLRLHYIGQLQRNKARGVVHAATMIHSIDRPELASELEKRAAAIDKRIEVLVEVNVAGEASKSGCAPDELALLLDAIRRTAHLALRGLMVMPPIVDDPEQARPHFARLRELRDRHGSPQELPQLSMGMSHDFEVAIAEGATIVRVGTAIFGPRQ